MSLSKTIMTGYSTLEYRDKIEKEQKEAIAKLLDVLPSFVTDYNKYKKLKPLRRRAGNTYRIFMRFVCSSWTPIPPSRI